MEKQVQRRLTAAVAIGVGAALSLATGIAPAQAAGDSTTSARAARSDRPSRRTRADIVSPVRSSLR